MQGIGTKQTEVFQELRKMNIDIAILTEVKKKGSGTEEINEYLHIYSGVPKDQRARCGVSIVLKKKFKNMIKSWDTVDERLIWINLNIHSYDLTIIGAYAPTENDKMDNKTEFYDKLTTLLESIKSRSEIILMGDLNARTGREAGNPVVGQYGEDTVNNNGERLIELCQQHQLRIWNGFFQHRDIHKYTWTQRTRNLRSIIDYVISTQEPQIHIEDVRVYRGAECGSDHALVRSKILFPYKAPLRKNQEVLSTNLQPHYNLDGLNDESTVFLYKLRLSAKLNNINKATTQTYYNSIAEAIHQAAYESLGRRQRSKDESCWLTPGIKKLIQRKKMLYQKWLRSQEIEDRKAYVRARQEVKVAVIKEREKQWERTCNQVNTYIGGTKSNEAWRVIKSLRENTRNKCKLELIKPDTWKNYYQKLLTEDRNQFSQAPTDTMIPDMTQCREIDATEVKEVTKTFKTKKAPGPGGITIELIKYAPDIMYDLLAKLFNRCLRGEEIPDEWNMGYITNIHKQGSRNECANYRGITVLNTISRIYGKILKKRIEESFKDQEEQNGFRAGRSCIDGIFSLRQLMEKRAEHNLETHLVFIDIKKAYDNVPLQKLWTTLATNGVREVHIRALKNIYGNMKSAVKIGSKLTEEFRVTKGLRQGCCIAPTLFKIYLYEALKEWRAKCKGMGIPIGNDYLYTLHFADDQVICAQDEHDAQYMLNKLTDEYAKWGLDINVNKTEYMVVGAKGQNLNVKGQNIKCVERYKYLGTLLASSNGYDEEIKVRVGQCRKVIRTLHPIIWNKTLTKRVKRLIYKSIVEPILIYGSDVWTMTARNKMRLQAAEMEYWRRSCGLTKLDKVRNEEIRRRAEVDIDVTETIEVKQLAWYGHLNRMQEERWPKKLWKWQPPVRRKRGRPKARWKEAIEAAMESRGLTNEDTLDRCQWRLGCGRRRQM